MTLGHYQYKNTNPNQPGYGQTIDIDVDALPKTNKLPNVQLPNVHIDENGYMFHCLGPQLLRGPSYRGAVPLNELRRGSVTATPDQSMPAPHVCVGSAHELDQQQPASARERSHQLPRVCVGSGTWCEHCPGTAVPRMCALGRVPAVSVGAA